MTKIIRFIERIGSGFNRLSVTVASLAVICVICAVVWLASRTKGDYLHLGLSDDIDVTPTVVRKMQSIGQWEFLTISDEELVDTIRKGFISDDELVRIYYGTIRLGIDLGKCTADWISSDKDSVYVKLPEIVVLDDRFIDEAATKSFFESGKWSNKDRQNMYDRAQERMLKRCVTPENMQTARHNAERSIKQMLQPIVAPKTLTFKN